MRAAPSDAVATTSPAWIRVYARRQRPAAVIRSRLRANAVGRSAWPRTAPRIRIGCPSTVICGGEDQAAAGGGHGSGLDADDAGLAEQAVDIADRADDRELGGGHLDDVGEGRDGHRDLGEFELVVDGADGAGVPSGRVGVAGVAHAEGDGGGVHLGDERRDGSGIPAGQDPGDVVGAGQHEGFERLALGEVFAAVHRDGGLGQGLLAGVFGGFGGGDGEARAAGAGCERVIAQYDVRRHDLGDAGDRPGCFCCAGSSGVADALYVQSRGAAGRPGEWFRGPGNGERFGEPGRGGKGFGCGVGFGAAASSPDDGAERGEGDQCGGADDDASGNCSPVRHFCRLESGCASLDGFR